MATQLLHRYSWIFLAVLMLASIGSSQSYAQTCPTKDGATIEYTFETCPGAKDGTATITMSDGVAPYAFVLEKRVGLTTYTVYKESPEVQGNSYTFEGLERGNYRIEIYDSQVETCIPVYSAGFIIGTTGATPADVTISGLSEVCEGQTGVSYSVPLTAGSSYSWSVPTGAIIATGATGPENNTITVNFGSTGGQVKVTETNSGGCSGKEASLNVNVTPAPTPYKLTSSGSTTFCTGDTGSTIGLSGSQTGVSYTLLRDGSAVATVAGSGSAISFGSFNITGTYTASANFTSGSVCTATMDGSVVLNATTPPTLSANITSTTCFGSSDGAIDLTVVGGTAPFSYEWNTGAVTEDITGLVAGSYTVTVTDASGCSVAKSFDLTSPAAISHSAIITQVTCNGQSNGAINLTVSGGTTSYTYEWNNGANTEDISGLAAGTYTIIIRDANGCTVSRAYEITQPAVLGAAAVTIQQVACNGQNTGAIDLTVNGGTAPYTYEWSNGATTEDLSGLSAGTYSVTVKDASGCTTTASATVNQPAVLEALAVASDATTCGGSEGSINLSVSGGTAPYSYEWSNGATTEDLSGLTAGTYTVTITDASGCTASASATVAQPAGISSLTASTTNVSCNGASTGAIDLTVNGGTAPYTYEWSNGATTEDLSGLSTGTYSVTVTDAINCQSNQSFQITEPAAIQLSASLTHVACAGATTGSIDLSVAGGTAPYRYSWSNGATTQDLTSLAAGTYTIIIRDANNCESTAAYTIENGISITLNTLVQNTTCNGTSTGAIDLTVNGGTAPYSYEWSNGATTEDLSGLSAGTYSVTVKDASGCTTTASATVAQPAVLEALAVASDATTCGGSEGSINLSVSGGTAPYSYEWSNGATTEDLSGLTAGTYTVTITDASGCTASASATVAQPAGISSLTASTTNVSCNGTSTGAIDLTVNGGTAPYTYEWSNGATTEDLSGLAAGDYAVTVTDANRCKSETKFVITQPEPVAQNATLTHILCAGAATGAIDLTVSGGTAPYTYSWSNGAATQDLTNLVAGTYSVIITDSNGCQVTAEYTISEPTAISASTVTTAVSCNGGTNGSINLTVSGGTAPYAYLWNNGAATEDLSNIAAGTYSVTITDANGCTATASATVSQPAALTAAISGTTQVCPGESNGSLRASGSGGTSPYTYSWSTGSNAARLNNLGAGTYTLTVTDANGCTATATQTIIEQTISVNLGQDINTCSSSTASVTLKSGYNNGSYDIIWSNGRTGPNIDVNQSGAYSVTVTDKSTGCVGTDEVIVNFIEDVETTVSLAPLEPITCSTTSVEIVATVTNGGDAPTFEWYLNGVLAASATTDRFTMASFADNDSVSVRVNSSLRCTTGPATASYKLKKQEVVVLAAALTNTSCFNGNDGAIDLTISGGVAPYTISWSNKAITEDISGLTAGEYAVTVTDNAGCVVSASYTIGKPVALSLSTVVTDLSGCLASDGAIDLSVTGGTAPYQYDWVELKRTTEDVNNLLAGTYTIIVTDAAGCSATVSATVNQPAVLNLSASTTNASGCGESNGAIDLSISGGVAPYTFEWSNSATTEDINNLTAGTYTVTVTDANGCSATLTSNITEPNSISNLTATTTDVLCNGAASGAIDLTVNGGTAPYTYEWSNGAATQDLTGLTAGEYTVEVSDANGCRATQSFAIAQPAAAELTALVQHTTVCGAADGSIDLSVTGGVEPYTYQWSNGASTEDLSAVTAGTYTITVTDTNGCTATATYSINDGNGPVLTASIQEVACFGAATGAINLTVTGGVAPYTYSWSNGTSTEDVNELTAGAYTVTVVDANGCRTSAQYTIAQPAEITSSTNATNLSSCSGNDGAIDLTVNGGTAPYTYEWSNGAATEDLTGLAAGNYTVTITDANGCVATATATISQPAVLDLNLTATNATTCGGNQGSIDLTVVGGVAPYTYAWSSNSAATEDINKLTAGTYSVVVTDAEGCSATASATITEPSSISSLTAATTDVLCNGAATGAINLTVNGGEAPYTYLWSNGATAKDLTGLTAGTYAVEVRDANGCRASESFTISQPAAVTLSAKVQNTSNCGDADGAINLTVSGGTAPYVYEWSNGAVSEDLTGLTAGTYTLIVTDAGGCTQTATYTVNDANGPTLTVDVKHNVCFGTTEGAIQLIVSGGIAPYTYSWNTGAATDMIAELAAGTYSVTVTDANGCSSAISTIVSEPAELVANTEATAISCNGNSNGSIDLTVSGGTAPYIFSWSNSATAEDINNLAAGSYTVTITDANGCTIQANATITEPAALTATIDGTSSICAGSTEGSLTVTSGGGVAAYTYLWNTGATSATINNLAAGNYSVTVTDANGCTANASFTISENQLVVNLGADIAMCAPASVELKSGYTTEAYDILWSTGETTADITVTATNIYSVTVTDRMSGCAATDEVKVEIENNFVPAVEVQPTTEITCNSSEVVLEAVATYGGTAPSFQWYRNGSLLANETAQQITITTFRNGDEYKVEVVSGLSCAEPKMAADTYMIELPTLEAPVLTATEENVCLGNSITAIGAVNGANLRWYKDRVDRTTVVYEGTSFTPTDNEVGTFIYYATEITTLCGESPATKYALTLYEGDCEPTSCTVNPTVAVSILPGDVLCSDIKAVKLEATVNQVGENAQYTWFYKGVQFSTEASPIFTLPADVATGDLFKVEITITDESFICDGKNTVSDEAAITINEQVQATASIKPIDAVCAESTTPVTLTAEGTYIDWTYAGLTTTYEWDIDGVKQTTTTNSVQVVPGQLTAGLVKLAVKLPAELACVQAPEEASYQIQFTPKEELTVSLSSSAPNGACPGTAITFTASSPKAGTNPTYTFFVNETEVQSGISSSLVLTNPQNGQQVKVKVRVTDPAVACVTSEATSVAVEVKVLTSEECIGESLACGPFTIEVTELVRPSCAEDNGKLTFSITSTRSPFRLTYELGDRIISERVNAPYTFTVDKIPALQELTITLGDDEKCVFKYMLEEAPRLSVSLTKAEGGDITCYGENTGKAVLSVTGGNAPYQYLLEGSDTWQTMNGNTHEFTTLKAGINNILVRQNESDICPATASVEIKNLYDAIEIKTTITAEANCNDKIGSFTLDEIKGGVAANGYRVKLSTENNWRTYTPGMSFSGLARGSHTLIINDGVCEVNRTVVVPSPGDIVLSKANSAVIPFNCSAPELLSGIKLVIDKEKTNFDVVGNRFIATLYKLDEKETPQQIGEPETFSDSLKIFKLEKGVYHVTISAVSGKGCPEYYKEFKIEGNEAPTAISFKAEPGISCDNEEKWIRITDLKGDPQYPFHIIVKDISKATAEPTVTITRAEYELQYKRDGYWNIPVAARGGYEVRIEQDQTSCPANETSKMSGIIRIEAIPLLDVKITGTTVSFPERATGTLSFRITNGSGTAPYQADLVWITRIEGQEDWVFESYGDPVILNGTTGKYDFTYNNLPPGNYVLTVTDAKGCSVILTETIGFDTNIFVPNFISPNGDGKNDVFYIRNKVPLTQLIITNRWGKVVYDNKDYKNDWDGDSLPEGIYYYIIRIPNNENGELKGWLQIKRGAQPY